MIYDIEILMSDGSISILRILSSTTIEQIGDYSLYVDGVEINFKDRILGIWSGE